jgi:hypothetical protein
MSGRVFVAQVPWRFDRDKGVTVAHVDITSAAKFGEIVEMLPLGQIIVPLAVKAMRRKMEDFNADTDYVLAVGNPVLYVAAAVIAAARSGGRVRLLQWERDQSADMVDVNGKARRPGYYVSNTIDVLNSEAPIE